MKKNSIFNEISKAFGQHFFTEEEAGALLSEKSTDAVKSALSYLTRNGQLVRYKRGVYSLSPEGTKALSSKFNLANKMKEPSFVSFESALSHYGLIPEAVYQTTSANAERKQQKFTNDLGVFVYQYLPVVPFYLDVEFNEFHRARIARPLRALFDTVYACRKTYNSLKDLEMDLRIEADELHEKLSSYSSSDVLKLAKLYKKKNIAKLSQLLIREFK